VLDWGLSYVQTIAHNQKTRMSNPTQTLPLLHCDVLIAGAGIAGLWTLHRLSQLGLSAILIESNAIGAGQTVKSQGIIHGGLKYALGGALSSASEAAADLPARWQACLENQGELPLQNTKVLSKTQYLWSPGSLSGQLMSFFASKTLQSRVQSVPKENYPAVFQNPGFKGKVYELNEWVLDIPSLLQALSEPYQSRILKINDYTLQGETKVDSLEIRHEDRRAQIRARYYVFTTGHHNQSLAQRFPGLTPTQERPLHMVWGMFPLGQNPQLYGHCLDRSASPRVTITTHPHHSGRSVWYLGGSLAETGVARDEEAQIYFSRQECQALFPWLDFSQLDWGSLRINRAEPKQAHGQKPDSAQFDRKNNLILGWPTKLAMAPLLADQISASLAPELKARPPKTATALALDDQLRKLNWEQPKIAASPWETEL